MFMSCSRASVPEILLATYTAANLTNATLKPSIDRLWQIFSTVYLSHPNGWKGSTDSLPYLWYSSQGSFYALLATFRGCSKWSSLGPSADQVSCCLDPCKLLSHLTQKSPRSSAQEDAALSSSNASFQISISESTRSFFINALTKQISRILITHMQIEL